MQKVPTIISTNKIFITRENALNNTNHFTKNTTRLVHPCIAPEKKSNSFKHLYTLRKNSNSHNHHNIKLFSKTTSRENDGQKVCSVANHKFVRRKYTSKGNRHLPYVTGHEAKAVAEQWRKVISEFQRIATAGWYGVTWPPVKFGIGKVVCQIYINFYKLLETISIFRL